MSKLLKDRAIKKLKIYRDTQVLEIADLSTLCKRPILQ